MVHEARGGVGQRLVRAIVVGIAAIFAATLAGAPAQAALTPAWSGWSQLPGGGATPGSAAPTTHNDSQYVFVRGTDNRISLQTHNGVQRSAWREVPGTGLTPSAPAA